MVSSLRFGALLVALAIILGFAMSPPAAAEEAFADELFQAMKWRLIGPFRGGRSVAAAGVVSDPLTYYFGATGGGVWKTTDAGITWKNVSDGFFKTGSVGAVSVSESDPNVIYVGMGEHAIRGVMDSHGDGVYKSTDAGRTWTHMGLETSRAISRIRIHPANPEMVYVAVQGSPRAPTEDRGIYRSTNGGANWKKVHFVSDRAGAADLAMDMTNPRILYASFWDHLRPPWKVVSGGEGSGIWKSTDGGDNWEKLTKGLPELMGKIGIDVSRANPDRVFANVEAEEGGLFRSDDAGKTWTHVNKTRIIQTRSWYYMEVFADPQDAETVYILNAPMMRSTDGGKTFTQIRVPHGDNHDLWINPTNNKIMINANDGGANVSFNGAASWSTQQNQPTAQFYRVITDNQFPYWVYGGQQDNTSVAIASAAPGGIGWKDWVAASGCESAYLAFDPDDPEDVYGGCYQGLIDVWNRKTGARKPIMAYPFLGLGTFPRDQKYRFNWNAPIVASPHDPSVIYHAGNVLFKTTDKGQSWQTISPDLTRNDVEKQGPGGGPITNEGAGGENYNTIYYFVESPHAAGTYWVGTDDGLVHISRDRGQSWNDVTPEGVGDGMINSIEVSPHDPATAYIAVNHYKFNDFTPHIYKTKDYGGSWQRIVEGIEAEAWVRVVREDPVRPGLLYAGTELGAYISFDDGLAWQKWQLNLPIVPITDLTIRNNDLVAATQGRAFWILDDLSPVQQISMETAEADVHLFEPRPAIQVQWGGRPSGGSMGQNPPAGAQIFVHLKDVPEDLVTMEILGESGEVLRTYASDPKEAGDENLSKLKDLKAGLNRLAWNFRRESLTKIPDIMVYGSLNGRLVAPGTYRVRLKVGDATQEQSLEVKPDPRRTATMEDYQEQEQFLAKVFGLAEQIHTSVNRLRAVKAQVEGLMERTKDHAQGEAIETSGKALVEKIDAWETQLIQPKQKTFQDIINFENQLGNQVLALIESVDGTEPPITLGARERAADLEAQWSGHRAAMETLLTEDVASFNTLVKTNVDPVIVPEK
jgi:photosystem II stability/assembly factor-like uncharacterized protein